MIVLLSVCLSMSACTAVKAVVAMNKSTDHFIALDSDMRVLYEDGADEFAENVSSYFDSAIHVVEQRQYRTFSKPIVVYVCHTQESFAAYCVNSRVAGCVLNERLFLAPKAEKRTYAILTHELSHLHMEQQLGMIEWQSSFPSWFQEGLAVYVSGGGGAEKVTPNEAKKSITEGLSFFPDTSVSLIFKKTARSYGLKPHMFYRQASMFIEYLHDLDELKFKTFLLSVEDGKAFEGALSASYGQPIGKIWHSFVQQSDKHDES
jgi:hypothetical protein